MRRALKISLAGGLAGAGFTGYLAWREIFVLHGSLVGVPTFVYGCCVLLVIGSIVGLRMTQPRSLYP